MFVSTTGLQHKTFVGEAVEIVASTEDGAMRPTTDDASIEKKMQPMREVAPLDAEDEVGVRTGREGRKRRAGKKKSKLAMRQDAKGDTEVLRESERGRYSGSGDKKPFCGGELD